MVGDMVTWMDGSGSFFCKSLGLCSSKGLINFFLKPSLSTYL